MKVCIIGKAYHAKLHEKYIKEENEHDEIIFYHPSFTDDKNIVNEVQYIVGSDLVIIASPTKYHLEYLRLLKANSFKGYVYVEKPGFDDPRDEKEIVEIGQYFRGRIKIGYHMRDCKAIAETAKILNEMNNGCLTIARLMITKNISESLEFESSWRSKDRLAISHTLASHLLSIAVELFGIEILEIIELGLARSNKKHDTCIINGFSGNLHISGVASWGLARVSPYIEIIGKDYKLVFSDNRLELCVAEKGKVAKSVDFADENMSIKKSILHFVSQARGLHICDHKLFEENVKITMKSICNVKEIMP